MSRNLKILLVIAGSLYLSLFLFSLFWIGNLLLFAYLSSQADNISDPKTQIKYYNRALALGMPKKFMGRTLHDRGHAYKKLKQYKKALEDFTKSIEFDKEKAEFYHCRAHLYEHFEEYSKAIVDFTTSISLEPKDAYHLGCRSGAYVKLEEFKNALKDCKRAIALKPNSAFYLQKRASVAYKCGGYDLAKNDIDKAIKLKPKEVSYYQFRSLLDLKLKNLPKALEDANKAIELSNAGVSYLFRGFVYVSMGEFDKGLLDYNRAIEFKNKKIKLYGMRGVAFLLKNDVASAMKDFKKYYEKSKNIDSCFCYLLGASKISKEEYLKVKDEIKGLSVTKKFDKALLHFILGKTDKKQLITVAGKKGVTKLKRKERLSFAYLIIAEDALIQGDREKARKYFNLSLKNVEGDLYIGQIVKSELKQMDKTNTTEQSKHRKIKKQN
jgi:tetratricopeptide (TPR) repeat protein